MGNAPTMTETIVAAKIAKRCQAGGVSPSGTGQNQMTTPRATTPRRARSVFVPAVIGPLPPRAEAPRLVRPSMSTERRLTSPLSWSTTYCQANEKLPSSPAKRPVPPVIVAVARRPVPIGSAWMVQKILAPRSSVKTARPTRTAPPSSKPITSLSSPWPSP